MDGPEKETVFETAALAGEILLASGAEIFRVDETMCRIARAYQCGALEPFVLSNGIFLSSGGAGASITAPRCGISPWAAAGWTASTR